MDELVKDIGINNLIDEYARYSSYFFSFQNHIENLYTNHIINIKERNSKLKLINDLVRQLNTTYNTKMMSICNEEGTELDDNLTLYTNGQNIKEMQDLINIHKLFGINNYTDYFIEIKDTIINKLGPDIGYPSIRTALSILVGSKYEYIFDEETNKKIEFYNKVFIPLNCSVIYDSISDDQCISIKKVNDHEYLLLESYCNINIKNDDNLIILSGYFAIDSLNLLIRTSQLCNNDIYQKKKELETFVAEKKEINTKFFKSYMRNISICDLLTLSSDEFHTKILHDYETYNNLVKLSFIHLMKEFVKDESKPKECVLHMFNTIKLLLLGSDESVNIAGLLFGITKEKKIDSDFAISDIIYKNLSYLSQIKLRKTSFNIKAEIDRIKSISTDDVDLKKQVIIRKDMPDQAKKAAFEKIDEMKLSNNEYYKQLMYVKTLLNFPWPSTEEDSFFANIGKNKGKSKEYLDTVVQKLDNKVYGHTECKNSIKELIGKWIANPSSSGSAIGLAGPPGVGKTLIAKEIGNALGIPFVQITLGGQNDGELLHGHGYTYSGSQPGMIVKKMVEAGNSRCIMYFDELDKACRKYDNNEIYNILIHITDPNTNTEFQDRFFQEIKFPLNKVLFVFSYNESSLIDNILMDRIKEITVKPFKPQDKKIITNKFLINEMCDLVGFEYDSIQIEDKEIDFLTEQYTNEPGVRDLKRKLEKIFLKLNIDRIYNTNLFEKRNTVTKKKPIVLTKEIIEDYLGKNNVHIEKIHEISSVGVINGLYCTERGQGGILPIQIYDNYTNDDGKFILKLTGNHKKIMKESIMEAFTTSINMIRSDLRDTYINTNSRGLHIHTPSSVLKNGPSAGIVFSVAIISRILNKKIRNDVAATGEIELTGKIAKIGGLQYKLPGAKKAGVKLVLVSFENEDDVNEMKKEYPGLFDESFEVLLVKNLRDCLEHMLIDYDPTEIV